jgi:hypothetical protein
LTSRKRLERGPGLAGRSARKAGVAAALTVDSMATRGASGLALQRHWQMMGALGAVDGVLLFGVSTAYMFAVMQTYWSMLAAQAIPAKAGALERTVSKSEIESDRRVH